MPISNAKKEDHLTQAVKKITMKDGVPVMEDTTEKMTLEQMQKFVDGYIEICPSIFEGLSLVVNEEAAWRDDLKPNSIATKFVKTGTMILPGGIKGNALLIRMEF